MSFRGNGFDNTHAAGVIDSLNNQTIIVCFGSTGCNLPFGGAIELQGEAKTARCQCCRHLCIGIVKVIRFLVLFYISL